MVYYCEVCKETINEDMYNHSVTRYGKPLCESHQKSSEKERLRKMQIESQEF